MGTWGAEEGKWSIACGCEGAGPPQPEQNSCTTPAVCSRAANNCQFASAATSATTPTRSPSLHLPATGGTLQQAQNVFVANTRLADTPADTSFDIELDIPATDNIMGWMYGLSYIPGSTGERTDVHDGSGDYAIYVPRLGAYKYGNRLHITVRLDDLRCDPGTGTYGTCNGGGKFELTTLMALSWFNENGEPVAENASGRDDAVKQFGFPGKQGEYGSPRSGPQPWFGTFYIGVYEWQWGVCVSGAVAAARTSPVFLCASLAIPCCT